MGVRQASAAPPKPTEPKSPLSAETQKLLDAEKEMKTGMPNMTNPALGPRTGFNGAVKPTPQMFDLARLAPYRQSSGAAKGTGRRFTPPVHAAARPRAYGASRCRTLHAARRSTRPLCRAGASSVASVAPPS
eukprot:569786-Prymnesium_polylepis.1